VEEAAMRLSSLWPLTVALAVAAPAPAAKKDEDKLQGTWKVVSVEHNGKKAEPKMIAGWTLVVAGDKMTARDGNDVMDESSFRLDAAAKPPAIDLTMTAGNDKGKTVRGIYRLDGDRLTICVAEPGKERPKEFRAPEGAEATVLAFERSK
jgi:uncharacterized protein (TIGR03067 family)